MWFDTFSFIKLLHWINSFIERKRMLNKTILAITAAAALLPAVPAMAGKTLDAIKQRGVINCGVHTGRAGFALPDANGRWEGFDVDYCRALAAAVLNDADKVKFIPTSTQTRLTSLQSGEIDVLARSTTWQLSRDGSLGILWAGVNFYDGGAFMVKKRPGLDSAKKLAGATVCVTSGSTAEKTTTDYFRANRMSFKPVVFENTEATKQAFVSGRCQVLANDFAALSITRVTELTDPDSYTVLPELVTKEPLGPAVRRGDEEWFSIARWTLYAMIEAEDLGIFKHNVDILRNTTESPELKRFLGTGDDLGKHLGLDKEWSYRIVKQVGNYGESFDTHLGRTSKFRIPRGPMRLWKNGGLMYSPPFR
jgi:general L-amino acid transport system substrate-binding protein